MEKLRTPTKLNDAEAAFFAALGATNLHFFGVFIWGCWYATPLEGFHGAVCARLEKLKKPFLALHYRGALKTTWLHRIWPVWQAAKDPKGYSHIQLVSDVGLGKQTMSVIRNQIESNRLLRRLYPDLEPSVNDWSIDRLRLARRDEGAEPTFELRTLGQSLAGRHPKSVGIDDPTNDENYASKVEQDTLKNRFDLTWPTVESEQVVMSATPYVEYDVTHYVLEQLYPDDFDVMVQPIQGGGHIGKGGEVVWDGGDEFADPFKWNGERLEGMRRRMRRSPRLFQSQYFLTSYIGPDELGFNPAWWENRVDVDKLPTLSRYIAVDPASGVGTSAPAIAVAGIDGEGNCYALASSSHYKSEAELVNGIFAGYQAYKPVIIGIERYGQGGYSIFELVQREARRRRIGLPLVAMTEPAKDRRIVETLRPEYEFGTLHNVTPLKGGGYEHQLGIFVEGVDTPKDELDAMSLAVILCHRFGFRRDATLVRGEQQIALPPGVKRSAKLAQMCNTYKFIDEVEEKEASYF